MEFDVLMSLLKISIVTYFKMIDGKIYLQDGFRIGESILKLLAGI